MAANLDAYNSYMEGAIGQGAQIIVFPELGLGCDETDRAKNAEYGGKRRKYLIDYKHVHQ